MFTVPTVLLLNLQEKKTAEEETQKQENYKKETKEGTVFIDDVDFVCWLTDFCYPMLFAQDKIEF